MAMNPVAAAAAEMRANKQTRSGDTSRDSGAGVNVLDELKRLRAENRRLQALCLHRTEDAGMVETGTGMGPKLGVGVGVAAESAGSLSVADVSVAGTIRDQSSVTAGAAASALGGVDSTKMNKRLKEMFRERISIFREAVYLLTGYKVDLFTAEASSSDLPKLKVRSMYAETPDDCLLFQWRGDVLELLETPFASSLDPTLFHYLTMSNNVPAFLSNVTLVLFEKSTLLG